MPRKTNNSSQMLSSLAAQALTVGLPTENQSNDSNGNNKQPHRTPKVVIKRNTVQSSSSDDAADADVQKDEDSSEEADDEEDEDGEPADFSPSVRATIEEGEQAGLPIKEAAAYADLSSTKKNKDGKKTERSAISSRHTSRTGDESEFNYEDVNNISDSSDAGKAGDSEVENDTNFEELEAKAVIANASEWDLIDFDDLEAGMMGQDDDFYYQTGSSIMASDDYQSYVGPAEGFSLPTAPMPSPEPSPKRARVRFESPVGQRAESSHLTSNAAAEFFSESLSTSATVEEETSQEQHAGDSDAGDGGSSSGYETDGGETTDDEGAPANLTTQPQALLRAPALSSLDTSVPAATALLKHKSTRNQFKVPAKPALQHKGPAMGSFKTDPTRSYCIVDTARKQMNIFHARKSTPGTTPRPSRVGSVNTNSAPMTPVSSYATLAAAPDMSDVDWSDMTSVVSASDPVLSAGPNFGSAGFSNTLRRSHPMPSSVFVPAGSHKHFHTFFGLAQAEDTGNPQDDDPELEEVDMDAFIDFGNDSDSEQGSSASEAGSPSPTSPTFQVDATSTAAPSASKGSPTSESSAPDHLAQLEGGLVTAFRRGTQSQQHRPTRKPHGLALTKPFPSPPSPPRKRKRSESFGNKPPHAPSGKRRLR